MGRADLRFQFDIGSATLTEEARRQAAKVVAALKSPALSGRRFTIAGHSDKSGSRAYNQRLSQMRAEAVRDYIISLGGDPARLDVVAYGYDKPLPGLASDNASNRRVEIILAK